MSAIDLPPSISRRIPPWARRLQAAHVDVHGAGRAPHQGPSCGPAQFTIRPPGSRSNRPMLIREPSAAMKLVPEYLNGLARRRRCRWKDAAAMGRPLVSSGRRTTRRCRCDETERQPPAAARRRPDVRLPPPPARRLSGVPSRWRSRLPIFPASSRRERDRLSKPDYWQTFSSVTVSVASRADVPVAGLRREGPASILGHRRRVRAGNSAPLLRLGSPCRWSRVRVARHRAALLDALSVGFDKAG